MQVSIDNIGVIIAYVAPGAIAILGATFVSLNVRSLIGGDHGLSLGNALLFLLASLIAGLFADAVTNLVIEPIHHCTGVVQATWSYAEMTEHRFPQFEGIVQNLFRYHQFYANTFTCVLIAYIASFRRRSRWWRPRLLDLGVLALLVTAWLSSRVALEDAELALQQLLNNHETEAAKHDVQSVPTTKTTTR